MIETSLFKGVSWEDVRAGICRCLAGLSYGADMLSTGLLANPLAGAPAHLSALQNKWQKSGELLSKIWKRRRGRMMLRTALPRWKNLSRV